ncbi:hypothetical protein PTTG_08694 [Puccinia triticina 1-1 BBBD Race 1]|uniref:Uncharacterized protein n=1 Tax=Puccinia triticina (isolate 1-1 / race 1 (BBBD)) TaxID=630390 RepID=A0A180G0A6_PUCT1|nr:hypothetical protein PTTG_08694 [Puccinia triticina 1-1 BBBD Race 1]
MSGLNIHDATNSVKAAAQQTAPEAGEGSQMAQQPTPQTQEPDIDASQPAASSQASGPNPKPPKAAKPVKAIKPTTCAAAKNNATTPRAKPSPEGAPAAQLRDPEIAEIIGPLNGKPTRRHMTKEGTDVTTMTTTKVPLEPAADKEEPMSIVDDKDSTREADRETRAVLMAQIVRAKKAGDEERIKRYMKMYKSVLDDQKSANQRTTVKIDNPTSFKPLAVPQKRPTPLSRTTQVRNVELISGRSNSHDDGGFPPYFHKLLLECKGPLPLTIFNREWQEKALAKHSKNWPKI